MTISPSRIFLSASLCLYFIFLGPLFFGSDGLARSGEIDPSFGIAGRTLIDPQQGRTEILALAVQPDGKIIAVGSTQPSPPASPRKLTVWRHLPHGSPDLTFGVGGAVQANFAAESSSGNAVVLQSNGQIVVAGSAGDLFAMARLNMDGSLDTTFGAGGMIAARFEPTNPDTVSTASSLAIQSDGKIIIGGDSFLKNPVAAGYVTDSNMALARFNGDGSLDGSFGSNGVITANFGAFDRVEGLAIQPDGKIIVAGDSAPNSVGPFTSILTRFLSDGTPDSSFGINGLAPALPGSFDVAGLALQPDGKVFLAGTAINSQPAAEDFAVARFTRDGVMDISFYYKGLTVLDFGWNGESSGNERRNIVHSLALQPDGMLVVGGYSASSFALIRIAPYGAFDPNFSFNVIDIAGLGTDTFTFPVGSSSGSIFIIAPVVPPSCGDCGTALASFLVAQPFALAIQPGGKIIAGGILNSQGVLARFHGGSAPKLTVANIGAGTGGIRTNENAINCGSHCSAAYEAGTTVYLGWVAAVGSRFVSWAGCTPVTDGGCAVTLNIASNVSARFELEGAPLNATSILAYGAVGKPYFAGLKLPGGASPTYIDLMRGTMPPGTYMSAGNLVGTPNRAGRYRFTTDMTHESGAKIRQSFDVTIYNALALRTALLGAARVGANYKARLTSTGGNGPYSWLAVVGNLPPGLSLDTATGRISGTPTSPGTFDFTIEVSDQTNQVAAKNFVLVVN
jgi:uncharacterized delta-60 repeat protein